MKSIEEAVAVRDRLLDNFAKAALLPAGPARDRLLTVVVVGGGFAGIETFAELRALASALLKDYPNLTIDDTQFHLIEAMGRIMPEVSLETSHWVLKNLAQRAATVHLDTQLKSAVDGVIELSTGESFESDLIIWTAGVMANPVVRGTDLPLEERGRIRTRADLRVHTEDGAIVEGAWAAGDVSAVPDLSGGGVGGFCVPNAQHAVRQGKRLARTSSPCCATRSRSTTSTRTSAPSRASASATACSSRAASPSRASSAGSCTAATTASRSPCGSASCASSAAGPGTSCSVATTSASPPARSPRRTSRSSPRAPRPERRIPHRHDAPAALRARGVVLHGRGRRPRLGAAPR